MPVQSHRDLVVWNKAMDLAVQVYGLTSSFPASERWRLIDQLCRAAASVPANIAEGQGRSSPKDFAHFLAIARGSLNETETFIMLAIRLGYLAEAQAEPVLALLTEVSKMLGSLRTKVAAQRSR
ncbi:MAG: four helix bundle protein [Chloroflexi bacterium]|nr:four helix bundle protein [Chloroflexota bacterium]